jgi:hypothetical protein
LDHPFCSAMWILFGASSLLVHRGFSGAGQARRVETLVMWVALGAVVAVVGRWAPVDHCARGDEGEAEDRLEDGGQFL